MSIHLEPSLDWCRCRLGSWCSVERLHHHWIQIQMPGVHGSVTFIFCFYSGLPWWLSGKQSACQFRRCRRCRWCGFCPWVGKIPWGRKWQLAPVSCLGNSTDWGTGGLPPMGPHRIRRDLVTEKQHLSCVFFFPLWLIFIRLSIYYKEYYFFYFPKRLLSLFFNRKTL